MECINERDARMNIGLILHQMVQLAAMIGFGYLLYKIKLMDEDFNQKLTKLLVNFTLPAMILASVLEQPAERDYAVVTRVLGLSVLIYVLLPVLSCVFTKLLRVPRKHQGIYMFMFSYSNVGFMGFPVIGAIYGSTGIFYAAIVNIIFNISSFSVGAVLMNYGAPSEGEKGIPWKKFLSPGISVSVLSLIIYCTGVVLPADVVSVCSSLGGLTSPLAMLLVGATLATMDLRTVFGDWRLYPFTLMKQIVLPLCIWAVLRCLVQDPVILGTCTILMLMPVANFTVMYAGLHGKDVQLGARGIFMTTLFSIVSVPLMMYFIG